MIEPTFNQVLLIAKERKGAIIVESSTAGSDLIIEAVGPEVPKQFKKGRIAILHPNTQGLKREEDGKTYFIIEDKEIIALK